MASTTSEATIMLGTILVTNSVLTEVPVTTLQTMKGSDGGKTGFSAVDVVAMFIVVLIGQLRLCTVPTLTALTLVVLVSVAFDTLENMIELTTPIRVSLFPT